MHWYGMGMERKKTHTSYFRKTTLIVPKKSDFFYFKDNHYQVCPNYFIGSLSHLKKIQ